jgi:hypothetical protein
MEDIIRAIEDNQGLEGKATLFIGLSKQEKMRLLETVKAVRSEGAGRFLCLLYSLETDKDLQKQIKKLIFRLKTMGIPVEDPVAAGESVLKRVEDKRDHRGFMSNYDTEGLRLVLAAFEGRKHTYVLLHGITHFSEGLLELTNAPIEKRDLDLVIKEYRGDTKKPFFFSEIAPRYAAYLIEEASGYSGRFAEEVAQMRQISSGAKDSIRHPHDLYRLGWPEKTNPEPLEKIMTHSLFESFALTWNTIDQDRKAFEALSNPSIILPPYMTEEKKSAFLDDLIHGNLSDTLHLVKRMSEDYAYILHGMGEYALYRGLVELLGQDDGAEKVLLFLARKAFGKAEEKPPGILVNPYG